MPTRPKLQVVLITILPVILSGCFHNTVSTNRNINQAEPLNQNVSSVPLNTAPELPSPQTFPFSSPQPASIFRDSVPQSQDILPQAPIQVIIDATVPLTAQSTISITSEGVEYGVGQVSLSVNNMSLSRAVTQSAQPGLYTVQYSLCDESAVCSSGQFQFAIDSFWLSQYQNWTNLSQVEVSLNGSAYLPRYLRVSNGTTVTWTNDDQVSHTVDSDPFGSHSYNPSLSSFELKPGETYSFTFGSPGWYPYRCSFHAQTMTGVVIVE